MARRSLAIHGGPVAAPPRQILCIGGAVIDRKYRLAAPLVRDSSNPAIGHASFGGVARNVAETLAHLGARAALVSAVGDDEGGRAIGAGLRAAGVDTTGLRVICGQRTADYVALLDPGGELAFGIVDADIFETITPAALAGLRPRLAGSRIVFADCNLPEATLAWLAQCRAEDGFLLAVDTISVAKSRRIAALLPRIDLLFTNRQEAESLTGLTEAAPEAVVARFAERGVAHAVMTLGADGLIYGGARLEGRRLPAFEVAIRDVTGAGDALIAAVLAAYGDCDLHEACLRGLAAAAIVASRSESACPPDVLERIAEHLAPRPACPPACERSRP